MTALLALILTPSVQFRLRLEPGDSHHYSVHRDYTIPSESETTNYTEDVVFLVDKGPKADRQKVTVSTRLLSLALDGQVLDQQGSKEVSVMTQERTALNQVLAEQAHPNDPSLYWRQERPLQVRFLADAIQLGDSWTYSTGADAEHGMPPADWKWKLDSLGGGLAKILVDFHESQDPRPITATGTIVIDTTTGWVDSLDVTILNTVVPGDEEAAVASLHVTWKKT